ncbi:MarR family transcriptional regulator [Nonomuraea sp. B5E05]|uniref:MarR family winged helix-turn-helix transcriptional regulator n=1 Tax=Nonomuraea sp. B5E05 TaxID=3153569 RepID=UPI003261D340
MIPGSRPSSGRPATSGRDLLQRLGPLTAGELAQHTGLAPASISGLIDRLESRWLVRRVRDTKDRRRVIVEINSEQLAGFAELFAPFVAALAHLYERYTDDELKLILDYLKRSTALQREATEALTG